MTTVEAPETNRVPLDRVAVLTDPSSPDWVAGEAVEAEIFLNLGYIETAKELEVEYAKYLPVTEFATVKRDGEVEGATRLIFHDPNIGFKTLDDIAKQRLLVDQAGQEILDGLDLSRTFEVGTIGATEATRGRPNDDARVAVALYGIIFGESIKHDCPNVLASFDEPYLERFSGIFGPGVRALGPAKDYMGSPTVPVVMNAKAVVDYMGEMFPDVQKQLLQVANTFEHD